MTSISDRRLVTDSQMARILRVHVRWLRAEADAGRLPCVRAETRYLFDRQLIEQTLLERAGTERQGGQT
jgi:hypothetical protein